ncbi:acyl-CoA dehydrogenase family protein [Streptomyces sp. NPDC001941]|uniref:acyl-CoA dehydrogenase family protein n=1 Tax=Streptomyces sp. NPDC001941 TaxID=3154659 RepID=UPI00331B5AA5
MSPQNPRIRLSEVAATVQTYLDQHSATQYPHALVKELARQGVFGATVPLEYDGSACDPTQAAQLSYTLARSWQALAGLVGTHLKLCRQAAEHGTETQKAQWLPAMASGRTICARGYHEQAVADPRELRTRAELRGTEGALHGSKHWVTNARHADRILVIARTDRATVGVWVDPTRSGVLLGEDLPRAGMLGVSLAEVHLDDYRFDPEADTLGGWNHDLTDALQSYDVTSYATRAIAAVDAVHERVLTLVRAAHAGRSEAALGAITLRLGELAVTRAAMHAVWRDATTSRPATGSRHAKVFCTASLQQFLAVAVPLCGGAGFAGEDDIVARHYQDAIALSITGQPNDMLMSRLGEEDLCP